MPGMWDCHDHFIGADSYDASSLFAVPPSLAGARAARDLAQTIDAGFTSVRELAGYGIEIRPAVKDGWLRGPNIYSSGAIISMTSGHDDLRSRPIGLNKQDSTRGGPFYVADGPIECLNAVRMQVRRGADVIKIATSGGLGSDDGLSQAQYSHEEIRIMVEEAARNDLIVAAHAVSSAGVKAALHGGCRTIEHAHLADDECIRLIKDKDAILVPTRSLLDYGVRHPELFSREGYQKTVYAYEQNKKMYAKAIRAGVKIAIGTDMALSSPLFSWQHGQNGREFELAVEAGMTPLQAIEAGTATAPETLGPKKAPKTGQLREGFDADIIGLSGDPLTDISILAKPQNVLYVWKGGKLMKEPSATHIL